MDDIIDIALAADEGYKDGLLVTAWSIAYSCAPNARLRFNVLDGGLSDVAWDVFRQKILNVSPKTIIRRFSVDQSLFSNFPAWNFGSRLTYARFLLPILLKDSEYVIYCDTDFLWLEDIAKLWALRRSDVVCQSVVDGTPETVQREKAWFVSRELPFDKDRYFCAGLLFLNLELCRTYDVMGACLDFLWRNPDVKFADQSALNVILSTMEFGNRVSGVALLQSKWQRFSYSICAADVASGCVIHYAGDNPWHRKYWYESLSDAVMIWFDFYGRIFGIGRWRAVMSFYSVSKMLYLRMVFLALTMPVIETICYWYLERIRHAVIIDRLKSKNQRIRFFWK